MELKDFIGKVVISTHTKRRFVLDEITAPCITVRTEKPNERGYYEHYCWENDPIRNGDLIFEDASLTEPFERAYGAYCRTQDAYWETYGYWLHKSY